MRHLNPNKTVLVVDNIVFQYKFNQSLPKRTPLSEWWLDSGLTTLKFKMLQLKTEIEVLHEGLETPLELEILGFDLKVNQRQHFWVREVLIKHQSLNLMVARMLAPAQNGKPQIASLATLADQPLGFFLKNENAKRSKMEFCEILKSDLLFSRVPRTIHFPKRVWVRTSVFTLLQGSIYLTECFLPDLEYTLRT